MPSTEISDQNEPISNANVEKILSTNTSTQDLKIHNSNGLHFVPRNEVIPEFDVVEGEITGYDDQLMRARASLTSEEEKKLLRRLDWHLLPLLAVMYAVKTIDGQNVCFFSFRLLMANC